MSYSRRRFLKTAVAGCSGFALSSCGWTLAKVQTDRAIATSSDELHIYTWANYIDQEVVDAFRAKTGIKVTFDVFDSNETMLATFQAGKAGIYSIIYPSDYKVTQMRKLGYLSELDHLRLESLSNLLPRFQDTIHDPGNRFSVPVSWGTTGLLYNSEKLTDSPTDWSYLWDNKDKLNRRITLMNDVREVLGATLRLLGYSYNSKNPEELKKAYDRLQELKPAIATFTTDAWRDQLIAGDLLISMVYSSDAVLATTQNPKLKYVIPASGTSVWSDTMVIPKTAPNPDAAYAWMEFMLQPEVAAKLTERLSFATTNQKAIAKLPPEVQSNTSLFPSMETINQSESILPMERDVLEAYDRYWTKLTS
ncbi:ABC transporter substrate-binding protein [Leptolyngbya sp. NIES-2104]|uniref:ABC transporter substrate-binding protein n=1 Tax=Leptolyngbya sp. NIES-2104 TaxID=1552121 RepID=UPI0006EC958F|nr:spermidine/putrescine ABC transporter substrate-binding protein [Leptolyngbya sp. NIES-2104]GAP96553.1 ABC transporter, periplasmic spermidine putrescine-binding protein PotD [Leptolyngbya sp. NIES-2104]